MVTPENILTVVTEDPDDNRVLECAVEGEAHYIVTGDRHLLRLGAYADIAIMSVREFMEALGEAEI